MQNNKSIIVTLKTYYEVDIVIANKYTSLAKLNKDYMYNNNEDLDPGVESGIATCNYCINRKTNRKTIIIKYNHPDRCKDIDKKVDLINTCAHEATHAAISIFTEIGTEFNENTSEPIAYFIGWLTQEIYKVFKT